MANNSKKLSKKLLSVGEDVLTEVSKDQLKQLPKNAKTAYLITQSYYKPSYKTNNLDKEPINKQKIAFKYSPTNDVIEEFELATEPEETPIKSVKISAQVDRPVKEEYVRPGSVLVHKADITEVKKSLFTDED